MPRRKPCGNRTAIFATKVTAAGAGRDRCYKASRKRPRIIINDVDKLKELLDQPRYTGTNRIVPTNYRQLLYKPPLNIVWDDLGMCSPDLVGKYLQLDAKFIGIRAKPGLCRRHHAH